MMHVKPEGFVFEEMTAELRERIRTLRGAKIADHLRLEAGFAFVALREGEPVGFVSLSVKRLPPPLDDATEAFIDIIDVSAEHRREGIARELLRRAEIRAKERRARQIRAWSSEDKSEALQMWKALGYALCPATVHPGGEEVNGFFAGKVL